jgi:hypothetical protein
VNATWVAARSVWEAMVTVPAGISAVQARAYEL